MKIYTKTGDKGTTALNGGVRVEKDHRRIQAYGTVDELNSTLGLIRSFDLSENRDKELIQIQKNLFHLGAELATPPEKMMRPGGKSRVPGMVGEEHIKALEQSIDQMEEGLPPLTHFILPGGDKAAAFAHLARTVCRRAERNTVTLSRETEIREEAVKYLNRLSDYLFVLSRRIAFDNGNEEIKWLPNE